MREYKKPYHGESHWGNPSVNPLQSSCWQDLLNSHILQITTVNYFKFISPWSMKNNLFALQRKYLNPLEAPCFPPVQTEVQINWRSGIIRLRSCKSHLNSLVYLHSVFEQGRGLVHFPLAHLQQTKYSPVICIEVKQDICFVFYNPDGITLQFVWKV